MLQAQQTRRSAIRAETPGSQLLKVSSYCWLEHAQKGTTREKRVFSGLSMYYNHPYLASDLQPRLLYINGSPALLPTFVA